MDQVVERTVELDASPDDVWRALTEPDELAAWFGREAELDAQPGGRGRFVDDDGLVRRAVVDQVRPGEELVLRWWPEGDDGTGASVVTFVVAPTTSGSRLIVTERLAAAGAVTDRAMEAAAAAARTAWMWRLDLLLLRVSVRCRV
jgi:uncharacterized protein YndB with AHSA1/START domain